MSKCILFSRVSTEKQDIEQQTNVVREEILRSGYSEDDIVYIEYKESAIKLDEDERKGIQRLKEVIETNNDIDAVFIYELSRLSRKGAMLYNLRDYLEQKKIQLVCMKPNFRLLEDGKISMTANLLFSLFTAISEGEMEIKKARMARGKKKKKESLGYIGGYVALGYKIEGDKIVIDEDKAKYVRAIFNMYERGDSIRSIVDEMVAQGILDDNSEDNNRVKIRKILCHEGYTGQNSSTYPYPMIISPEQFKRCRELANDKRKPHTKTKRVYYLNGILYNEVNDRKLTPCLANNVYSSYKYEGKESVSINMDFIDSVILHIVNEYMISIGTNKDMKDRLRQQQLILHRKVIASKKRVNQLNMQIERIEERYIEGRITKEKAEKMRNDTLLQISENQININNWSYEIPKISEQIHNSTYRTIYDMDDVNKRIIIHNYIHKIFIKKIAGFGTYLMKVFMKNYEEPIEYTLISRNKKTKILMKDNENIEYKLICRK